MCWRLECPIGMWRICNDRVVGGLVYSFKKRSVKSNLSNVAEHRNFVFRVRMGARSRTLHLAYRLSSFRLVAAAN